MLIGYARVSSQDQDLTAQVAELTAAGCAKIYSEKRAVLNRSPRARVAEPSCYFSQL